jgi:N-acetylmuramoyl-L-alanine amidase
MSLGRRTFIGSALLAALFAPATFSRAVAARKKPHHEPIGSDGAGANTKRPLIMLDPGHGGKDPGAIGVTGTYEKRIALAAAQLLKRHLESTGRYHVRLTRARDVFIPLKQRVALAERHGASMFISLHADSLTRHNVRGASAYVFAVTASDPQSAALAVRENNADRFAPPSYRDLNPKVREILSNLIVEETRVGSSVLQQTLVNGLRSHLAMLPHPAREARFAVLRSVRIPSVLVEMGFMSNRQDERLLCQPRHRTIIANAMAGAVESYFDKSRNGGLFAS